MNSTTTEAVSEEPTNREILAAVTAFAQRTTREFGAIRGDMRDMRGEIDAHAQANRLQFAHLSKEIGIVKSKLSDCEDKLSAVMTDVQDAKDRLNDVSLIMKSNHTQAMRGINDNKAALLALKGQIAQVSDKLDAHIADPNAHGRAA